MRLSVNGESQEVDAPCSVAELIVRLGLEPNSVAVERNRAVVPRARHAQEQLAEGDELELVHFVGGG